jgi:hypothetical protein
MLTGRQAQKIVATDAADSSATPPAASAAAASMPAAASTSSAAAVAAVAGGGIASSSSSSDGSFVRVQQSVHDLLKFKALKLWRRLTGRKLQKWPADKRELFCHLTML